MHTLTLVLVLLLQRLCRAGSGKEVGDYTLHTVLFQFELSTTTSTSTTATTSTGNSTSVGTSATSSGRSRRQSWPKSQSSCTCAVYHGNPALGSVLARFQLPCN